MKKWGFKHISLYFFRSIELSKLKQTTKKYKLLDPVLDIGCGDGTFTEEMFGRGRDIIGIDNSRRELAKNKQWAEQTVFGDACDTAFLEDTFNTVFSNCVIEHIPDLNALLKEVSTVLNKEGYFVFTVPTQHFADYLLFSWMGKWYGKMRNARLNHYHCHNHGEWRDILKMYGLETVDWCYYLPKHALMLWDLLALTTFHFWWLFFPFAPLVRIMVNRGIVKYSKKDLYWGEGAAVVIVAKKI